MATYRVQNSRTSVHFFQFIIILTIMLQITACQSFETQTTPEKKLQSLNSRISIAMDYIDAGQPADALPDLRSLLREFPENSKVLALNAVAHLALNNIKQALEFQKAAYRIDPSASMGVTYAGTLIAADYLTQAEKVLNIIAEEQSYEFPERIKHNLGYIAEKRGRLKQAIIYYEAALQQNPAYFMSIAQLAQVYEKTGDRKKAASTFTTAISMCPTCFEPMNSLFHLYITWNNVSEANSLVNQYLKQNGLSAENQTLALKLKKKIDSIRVSQSKEGPPTSFQRKKG